MPYIDERRRILLDRCDEVYSSGELNYLFSNEINRYMKDKGLSYQTINDILGALEGAKQEFYQRVVIGYERKKRGDNGDVYNREFTGG